MDQSFGPGGYAGNGPVGPTNDSSEELSSNSYDGSGSTSEDGGDDRENFLDLGEFGFLDASVLDKFKVPEIAEPVPQADFSGILEKREPTVDRPTKWAQNGEAGDRALFDGGLQILKDEGQNHTANGYSQGGKNQQDALGSVQGTRMYDGFRRGVAAGRYFDPETPEESQIDQTEGAAKNLAGQRIKLDSHLGSNVLGPASKLLADFAGTIPKQMHGDHVSTIEFGSKSPMDLPHSSHWEAEKKIKLHSSALAQPKDKFLQMAVHELGHAYFEEHFAKSTLGAELQGKLAGAFATIRDGGALAGIDGGLLGDAEDRKVYQSTNSAVKTVKGLEAKQAREREQAQVAALETKTETVPVPETKKTDKTDKAEKTEKTAKTAKTEKPEKPPHILESASEFMAETFMAYVLHRDTLVAHAQSYADNQKVHEAWQTVLKILATSVESDASNVFMMDLLAGKK